MVQKRWMKIMLSVMIIWLTGYFADPAYVKAVQYFTQNYVIEQVQSDAPYIKVYVTGNRVSEDTSYTAKVSGNDLTDDLLFTEESKQIFQESKEGIHYLILLDNSLSVDSAQFQCTIKELVKLRKNMGEHDEMQLYTVGASHSKGEKKQIVSSKGTENLAKDIKLIRSIRRNQKKTVLYRSLTKILPEMSCPEKRTVVLLLTDGEDDSQGKDNKTYQVNNAIKKSSIPIYGILLKNQSNSSNVKKINNTRRYILEAGRGYYEDCHAKSDTAKNVSAGFKNIQNILFSQTYIVSLREEGNRDITSTDAALSLTCDTETIHIKTPVFLYQSNSAPDTIGPEVTGHEKNGADMLKITLEDDRTKNLIGIDEKENYTVQLANGKNKGKIWEIVKVTPDANGKDVQIVFREQLYNGDYEITFQNITDDSNQKNAIESQPYCFSVKDGLDQNLEYGKSLLRKDWWILVIILIVIIGVIVIILLRRRPSTPTKLNPEEMDGMDSRMIRLSITDDNGNVKDVDIQVEGSYFIGRSTINNLCFDDDLLSKQHFVIEVTKMGCYIEDLETKNSTFVNSVKISGRRKLSEGDVINAGRETFIFHTIEKVEK